MNRDSSAGLAAYGVAVSAVLAALLIRLAIDRWLGPTVPYLQFFPAILVASWYGGFGPGALASLLSALAADIWFLPPAGLFKVPAATDLNSLAIFFLVGLGISYLSGAMKRAEAAQRQVAEQWRITLASIGDAVVVTDARGRVRFVNEMAERLTGWDAASALDRPLEDVFVIANEETKARVESPVARVLREGAVVGLANHTALTSRGGRRLPIADSGAPIRGTSGEVEGVVLVFRDMTAEREAERALRESDERTRSIIEAALDAVITIDTGGIITGWSARAEEIFGWPRDEALGRVLSDTIVPDRYRAAHRLGLQRFLATGESVVLNKRLELSAIHRSGREFPIELSITPVRVGDIASFSAFVRDITDRRVMEQALVESHQHYQAVAESLPHLVWTCRPDGYCDFLSHQWVEYTGRSAEEQLGSGWVEQLHPDDRARVQAAWAQATERGDSYDVEFRIRRADGVYRWFKTRAVPLRDASGTLVKWFGSNTDFQDYKQSEQRLRDQLERLNLLDRLTRAIAERQDLQSILQVVVRSLEDHLASDFSCAGMYNAKDESLVVTCVGVKSEPLALELAMPKTARIPIDRNGLSRCVRGQLVYEPDLTTIPFPFPQRLARGGLRSLVAAPLVAESQVFGVLIVARRQADAFSSADCEFLRQLSEHVGLAAHQARLYSALQQAYDDLRQTQLVVTQQERLKALGQMASGIAHDINNAITPIALYTESLLQAEPDLSAYARQGLSIIQRATEDVAQTVARMREFYRQREPQLTLTPVDVNHLVEEVVTLTRARWSDMPQQRGIVIRSSTALAPDAPPILGVESEIREALINLIFNAVEAMPEGGGLTLRTRVIDGGGPAGAASPHRVQIEVSDTGTGMDADTRRRCLEPFFTTKGERGTGLGLAMVYGIVQRHGADLEIESAPREGTSVRLTFATSRLAVAEPSAPHVPPRPSALRILVVDDDPLLLRSLRDTLERDAHVVTAANGGQAGIDTFRQAQQEGKPFTIVITDLGMPYVDGRRVASAIKKASPDTPVILLTGWGQRLVDDGDVPVEVDRVLNKPPKLSELRLALAELTSAMP